MARMKDKRYYEEDAEEVRELVREYWQSLEGTQDTVSERRTGRGSKKGL